MVRRLLFSLVALLWLPACAQIPAGFPTTQPYKPVTYQHLERTNPPQHLHVLTIDLADPSVAIRVVPAGEAPQPPDNAWPTTLLQTSDVAAREHFDIAINGDFFAGRDKRLVAGKEFAWFKGNASRPIGPAMTDGKLWHTGNSYALVVRQSGGVSIERLDAVPADARQIVGGNPMLVQNGRAVAPATVAAPRTAVGLDREGKRLTLLVVDGRRADYSAGLTFPQLAAEMVKLDCWTALNLDGGGSTTLVMRDPATGKQHVINRPSDGHELPLSPSLERAVCNVVGITTRR
ncbi:MAG: phosphodiester glycosidase family protein [Tepidisphaerales bacterium]